MMFRTRFVELIPDEILESIIYVSMEFGTVIHKCACGCGREVNTPLAPNEWHLQYDGDAISLTSSIGNWSFPCRSHYWIRKNEIIWASSWDDETIKIARANERLYREEYFNRNKPDEIVDKKHQLILELGWFGTLIKWIKKNGNFKKKRTLL